VAERVVDEGLRALAAGLVVRLESDVELVALEVAAPPDVVGGGREDARADVVEDAPDGLVEVLVQQLFGVRAVPGREHAGPGLVDDREAPRVDEFVAEALTQESLDVLQGLTGADDDRDVRLVELREQVQGRPRNLVVRAARGAQRLVDVEHEDVRRAVVLPEEVEGGERLVAGGARGDLGERRVVGERRPNLVFAVGELLAGGLPVLKGDPGVDRREEVHEVLVGAEGVGVEVVVERVQPVVALHTDSWVGTHFNTPGVPETYSE